MINRKCYVIMQFGKTDDEKKKSEFIFYNLIIPSLQQAGYVDSALRKKDEINEVIGRADNDAISGGPMKKDIFENLLNSDLVIADVSNLNPNVFYELGIRHVLKKKGTVMIKDKNTPIIFDLADDYIHSYEVDPYDMEPPIDNLSKVIAQRMTKDKTDSPFHSRVLDIDDYRSSLESSADDDLRKENEQLREYIAKLEDTTNNSLVKIDFSIADDHLAKQGSEIVRELSRYLLDGNKEAFRSCLDKVQSDSDYIDEKALREIADLCEKIGFLPHAILILEKAHEMYSKDEKIFFDLMDAYIESSGQDKIKAKHMLFEYALVDISNVDLPLFSAQSKTKMEWTPQKLGTIFNSLIGLNDYNELLCLATSARDVLGVQHKIVDRNIAVALRAMGRYDESYERIKVIIQQDPSPSELRFMGDLFARMGEEELGYRFYELCTILEYDNAESYIMLAVNINNWQIARTEQGIVSTRTNRRLAKKSMLPLLLKAIELSPFEDTSLEVRKILWQIDAKEDMKYLLDNEVSLESLLERYRETRTNQCEWTALDYILSMKNDSLNITEQVANILDSKAQK